MVKRATWIVSVLVIVLVMCIIFQIIHFNSSETCPTSGIGSSAPINLLEFKAQLKEAVLVLKQRNLLNVVCTTINKEAAIHNLPPFLSSIVALSTSPWNINDALIIFCLDLSACSICREKHSIVLCVHMDLGLSSDSLAPGTNDKLNNDYWKLTYGRVFATMSLHELNVNVLAVDVDSVFLQHPFAKGNGIEDRPNDIAVVSDILPFTFQYGDKTPINGGFLYFPGVDTVSRGYSREVLSKVWSKNCFPQKNEQLVTSSVLRHMSKKYRSVRHYKPHMLPNAQYLNFCSTDCGSGSAFSSALSLSDLNRMDKDMHGKAEYAACEQQSRSKWVFFHAACESKVDADQRNVAQNKAAIQSAVLQWAAPTEK